MSTPKSISTVHNGITIEYQERDNSWHFTLRGRERTAVSLKFAREAIDAPPPKDKNPFPRTKAFWKRYSEAWRVVDVTSIASSPSWRGDSEFWIVDGKQRSKVSITDLRQHTETNLARVTEVVRIKGNIDKLHEEIDRLEKAMSPFAIPKNVE